MQFWELRRPITTKGIAEIDDDELERLKAQYGDIYPPSRMARVEGVPIPIKLGGSMVKSFTWTWQNQCIIQDSVYQMFLKQQFTGFRIHPISAKWKRKPTRKKTDDSAADIAEIPPLWELIPLGWGGVSPEESGVRLLEIRPDTRLVYSKFTNPSKLIDESQWDGSDFFIVWPLANHIFVTDRVAQFIKREGLTGAVLIRIEDMVWPSGIGNNCMPARLGYYLPEPRAKEIGEPLGIY